MTALERVRGEDVPVVIPLGLLLVGAVAAWSSSYELARRAHGPSPSLLTNASAVATSPGAPSAVVAPLVVPAAANAVAAEMPALSKPVDPDCAPIFAVRFLPRQTSFVGHDGELASLVAWLGRHADAQLLVNGYADASGAEDANLFVSHRRAEHVAKRFESAGIPARRMTVRAFGAFQPVVGEAAESAVNRRVTLDVTGGGACPSEQRREP